MKQQLEQLLLDGLRGVVANGLLPALPDPATVAVERTRDTQHGDFATNVALRLAKPAKRNPRELAQAIVAALPANPLVLRAEVAGAGFINFFLASDAYGQELTQIHEQADRYGESALGAGQKVLVEFVSANPTGPLHVGHGRQAAYGSTLANLLSATGYAISREYYINDAGRQVDIFTVSVWLRYLEAKGQSVTFPANGYKGDYLIPIGQALTGTAGDSLVRPSPEIFANLPPDAPEGDKDKHVDALIARMRALIGEEGYRSVLEFSLEQMLADIRDDLSQFGVSFEQWYSERYLNESGAINRAFKRLESQGNLYRKDGALWFTASKFGDEEDRVVERENGIRTYFASDIAYHLDKRERGFESLIDILGADHHGYVARVRGGLAAMGEPPDCLDVTLIQFVSLFRGSEKIPMGKREGQFVTLRQLRDEVGNDACRFFYLMRSHDQHLDFDLELAKSRTNENPVYYIQYAHARVASVMKQLASRGLSFDRALGLNNLGLLKSEQEQAVLNALARYPEVVEHAATNRAPHAVAHYLRELANTLHTYYNAEQFIVDDEKLRNARLALVLGVQQVIRNGLRLLGISAPESM